MKKLFVYFILVLFAFTNSYALTFSAGNIIVSGTASGDTPDHYFKFENCTSSSFYDEIDAVRYGACDAGSTIGAGYDGNSLSVGSALTNTLPGSMFYTAGGMTVDFAFQHSADNAGNRFLYISAGGDNMAYTPYTSAGAGNQVLYRADFGDTASIINTSATVATWHTVRIIYNLAGDLLELYIDGSNETANLTNATGLVDDASPQTNLNIFSWTAGTLSIDDLKIYHSVLSGAP